MYTLRIYMDQYMRRFVKQIRKWKCLRTRQRSVVRLIVLQPWADNAVDSFTTVNFARYV